MPLVKKAEIPAPLGFAGACEPYREMRVWYVVGGHERGTNGKKKKDLRAMKDKNLYLKKKKLFSQILILVPNLPIIPHLSILFQTYWDSLTPTQIVPQLSK